MVDSKRMLALVKQITEVMVDDLEQVKVDCITQGTTHQFRVQVAPHDLGKIIGKQGRHARAIREILSCASEDSDTRFTLDIVQPANESHR